jgi:poly(ADP-ribose) glycohydrolase
MSQKQVACLLANAFFCTFPSRNYIRLNDNDNSSPHLPSVNFNTLYRKASYKFRESQHAKFDCLLHYFRRVTSSMPCGTVTFQRQVLTANVDWSESDAPLQPLCVISHGTIEDRAKSLLHVDFANRIVGGGVLGEGCVQEEIRFLICPELIVSRLITEQLADNESLLVTGCERFSNYSGYGSTLRWQSNHVDMTARDNWARICCQVVAIDANIFHNLRSQLTTRNLCRELNKAFCGFCGETGDEEPCAVATGNWGCGVFGGDPRLKALLQLMAASEARRPLCYFTFSDVALCRDFHKVYCALTAAHCNVGTLWSYILEFGQSMSSMPRLSSSDLYRHILSKCLQVPNDDTDNATETLCDVDDYSSTYSDTP